METTQKMPETVYRDKNHSCWEGKLQGKGTCIFTVTLHRSAVDVWLSSVHITKHIHVCNKSSTVHCVIVSTCDVFDHSSCVRVFCTH